MTVFILQTSHYKLIEFPSVCPLCSIQTLKQPGLNTHVCIRRLRLSLVILSAFTSYSPLTPFSQFLPIFLRPHLSFFFVLPTSSSFPASFSYPSLIIISFASSPLLFLLSVLAETSSPSTIKGDLSQCLYAAARRFVRGPKCNMRQRDWPCSAEFSFSQISGHGMVHWLTLERQSLQPLAGQRASHTLTRSPILACRSISLPKYRLLDYIRTFVNKQSSSTVTRVQCAVISIKCPKIFVVFRPLSENSKAITFLKKQTAPLHPPSFLLYHFKLNISIRSNSRHSRFRTRDVSGQVRTQNFSFEEGGLTLSLYIIYF